MECARCGYKASATAGTIFDRTRLPLTLWFRAMWLVTNQKTGVSALSLQQQLGRTRYETVWTLLHKLRRAMVRPGRDRLSGTVEVDEPYVGGHEEGVRGRETYTKAIVAVAAEEEGEGVGRIRLATSPDVSGPSLLTFVAAHVEPGSLMHTDGWEGDAALSMRGYRHRATNLSKRRRTAHEVMPRGHRVAALLKRWRSARTRGPSGLSIWTTTLTSAPSGSTGGRLDPEGSCSIAWCSKPLPCRPCPGSMSRRPNGAMTTTGRGYRSQQ
jgi:hypothetical protein